MPLLLAFLPYETPPTSTGNRNGLPLLQAHPDRAIRGLKDRVSK